MTKHLLMTRPPNAFTLLKVVHIALVFGLLVLTAGSYVLNRTEYALPEDEERERIFQLVAVILSLSALLGGFSIFRRRIAAIRAGTQPGEKKMEMYRAACILWWALIQGPGMFAAISLFLTGNMAFLALALFHAGLLLVFMPRKDNIALLLKLTKEEVRQLEGKDW